MDDNICDITTPFVSLQAAANLKEIPSVWAPDMDLEEFGCQYSDILEFDNIDSLRRFSLEKLLKHLASNSSCNVVTTVLARIVAAKPHSADVERIISANNLLKSSMRSSLNLDTENLNLFVHINMPVLKDWNPRPAILLWMKDLDRRTKDTPKSKTQPWFNHIFEEAKSSESIEKEEIQDTEEIKKSFGV